MLALEAVLVRSVRLGGTEKDGSMQKEDVKRYKGAKGKRRHKEGRDPIHTLFKSDQP